MTGTVRKIRRAVAEQIRTRGLVSTAVMNGVHLAGIVRAMFYRALYAGRLRGSLFAMQGGSSIELFSRASKVSVGKFVFIRKNASIRVDGGELSIGEKAFINDNCVINCAYRITIGAYAKIAPNVCINDHDHNYRQDGGPHLLTGEVTIGRNVWIGANTVVLRGSCIGDNAVIAAGSVVNGIVPPDTVYLNRIEKRFIRYGEAGGAAAEETAATAGAGGLR